MPETSQAAPLKTPPCPRCRAAGRDDRIQPTGGRLVCFGCGTTWQQGEHGQMVAAGAR